MKAMLLKGHGGPEMLQMDELPDPVAGPGEVVVDIYAAGVILIEMLWGTFALADWLGDRGALLRGQARWHGRLPPDGEPARETITAGMSEGRPASRSSLRRLPNSWPGM